MGKIKKLLSAFMLVFFVMALSAASVSACNYNDYDDKCDCDDHNGYHDRCNYNCYDDDDDNCDNDDCYKYKAYENTKYVSFNKYEC